MESITLEVYDPNTESFFLQTLRIEGNEWKGLLKGSSGKKTSDRLYLSPGWIDSHAHTYHGGTDLGVLADRIGLSTGVHLVVDAGSSGSHTVNCFRDYVVPTCKTQVKAFLNISRIGLVTKQPYYDIRNLDTEAAAECVQSDKTGFLLGIKVLSSGLIVEDKGMLPMQKALEAAERAGCRIMAHLVEGPPSNEEAMKLLRKGDIITHCFHGKPNVSATLKATKSSTVNPLYYSLDNLMWNQDGTPAKPLDQALSRGVCLDVGHGAASLDQFVAKAAIGAGIRNFSISTDAHIRNVDHAVRSLPVTMSKFLAFGMTLEQVITSVTVIPARQLGLSGWCDDLSKCGTIFRVRRVREEEQRFEDANHVPIEMNDIIEPVAVIQNARITKLKGSDKG